MEENLQKNIESEQEVKIDFDAITSRIRKIQENFVPKEGKDEIKHEFIATVNEWLKQNKILMKVMQEYYVGMAEDNTKAWSLFKVAWSFFNSVVFKDEEFQGNVQRTVVEELDIISIEKQFFRVKNMQNRSIYYGLNDEMEKLNELLIGRNGNGIQIIFQLINIVFSGTELATDEIKGDIDTEMTEEDIYGK